KSQTLRGILALAGAAVDRVVSSASRLAAEAPTGIEARVMTGDAATAAAKLDSDSLAAAIFSPPYPNAYEYWLYHKYRMYWLGFDPISVREVEIGARPHFFKKNHHTADDFERQMAGVFRLLDRTLRPSGIACFVVADSLIHGRIVD